MRLQTNLHLTHQQLSDLLLAAEQETSPQLETSRAHLRGCALCSSELASLQEPIQLFRSAATAWAGHAAANRDWTLPSSARPKQTATAPWFLTRPALWTAAATLLFAAAIPLALHRHSASTKAPTIAVTSPNPSQQSSKSDPLGDEALLDAVDQTLASSVPTPMQPLADPTAGRSNSDSTLRKN